MSHFMNSPFGECVTLRISSGPNLLACFQVFKNGLLSSFSRNFRKLNFMFTDVNHLSIIDVLQDLSEYHLFPVL